MFHGIFFADSHSREVLAFLMYFRPGAATVFGFKAAEDPDRRFCVSSSGVREIHPIIKKEAGPPGHDVGAGGRDSDAIIIRRLVCAGPRALGHGGRRVVRVEWSGARRLVAVGLAGSTRCFVCFFLSAEPSQDRQPLAASKALANLEQ